MLTAKELHDLYNGPFTMKDGTRRRALWEREPKTRPERIVWVGLEPRTGGLHDTFFWTGYDYSESNSMNYCRDDAAAALCRVAVEDWLFSIGSALWYEKIGAQQFHVDASVTHDDEGTSAAGIHRALIEEAHRTADRDGVPF